MSLEIGTEAGAHPPWAFARCRFAAVIGAGEQGESVWFGPFRLVPAERLLEQEGIPVIVSSRALDILIFLVTHAGKVVSQRDLISHVWPRVASDGSGLRVRIMGLRKALGDGKDGARYVTNVAGRGYCFVAPIRRQHNQQPISALKVPSSDLAQQLPTPPMRMMGRDESRCRFNRTFKASFGCTPGQYVRRMRIARAQKLMTMSHDPLCQIAAESGFADQAHFNRCFHKVVGESPAIWRARRWESLQRTKCGARA
jgi:DNA-binding winged helix-turn-helix (wHTH) protein